MPTSSPVFSSGEAVVVEKAPAAGVDTLAWLKRAGLGSALRPAVGVEGRLLVSAPAVQVEGLLLGAFLPVQLGQT